MHFILFSLLRDHNVYTDLLFTFNSRHEELLAMDGLYANMWMQQQEKHHVIPGSETSESSEENPRPLTSNGIWNGRIASDDGDKDGRANNKDIDQYADKHNNNIAKQQSSIRVNGGHFQDNLRSTTIRLLKAYGSTKKDPNKDLEFKIDIKL